MPKELVYDAAGMFDVHVGWTPDSDMQVGVVTHGGGDLVKQLTAGDEVDGGFTGVWSTLDRDGVNRLIRVLRRARDSTFGADA